MRPVGPVCALLALVVLSGCSGGSKAPVASSPSAVATSPSPSASPTVSQSPSPVATATTSPTATLTSSPSSTPSAGPPECTSSSLELRAIPTGAAAGTDYISLVVTNTGSDDCLLLGYPGVTFLDSHGRQVGLPAQRDKTSPPHRVVLAAGEKGHASLSYPNPGAFGSGCGGTQTRQVQVFPPDETTPLRANVDAYVCSDRAGRSMVGAMRPGTRGF